MYLGAAVDLSPCVEDRRQHVFNRLRAGVCSVVQPVEYDRNTRPPAHPQHLFGVEQAIVVFDHEPAEYAAGQSRHVRGEALECHARCRSVEAANVQNDLGRRPGTERIEELRVIDELGDGRTDDPSIGGVQDRELSRVCGYPDIVLA